MKNDFKACNIANYDAHIKRLRKTTAVPINK